MLSAAISFRVSPDRHRQLKALAKTHKQTLSEYICAQLFESADADERSLITTQMRRVEKVLTALVQLGIETVDFQREGFSTPHVEAVQARSRARTAKVVKDLGLE